MRFGHAKMNGTEFTQCVIGQSPEASKERPSSLSQPGEGMRLIEAFFSIEDPSVRAELVRVVSSIARTVKKQKVDRAPGQADRVLRLCESHYDVIKS